MNCFLCGKPSTEAHHIVTRGSRKDLEKDQFNIIDLCTKCHNDTHTNKRHENTNKIIRTLNALHAWHDWAVKTIPEIYYKYMED